MACPTGTLSLLLRTSAHAPYVCSFPLPPLFVSPPPLLYPVVLETTMSTLSKEGPLLMPPMTKARRRKSADGHLSNTKPLRSSPLAGPALNRSPATPLLTVSSYDSTVDSPSAPPSCHVLHPKSSLNLDSLDPSSSTLVTPRRRGLGPIAAAAGRCKSLHIPSTSSSDIPHPSSSIRPTSSSEWEIDPLQSLSISRTPVRPRPASGISSFRPPIPTVEEEPDLHVEGIYPSSKDTSRNSSTSEFTISRSPSQPHVNSWLTTNTYDVTPRFSRLGLSANTVVMPISAKEHRRVSRRNSTIAAKSKTTNNSTTSLPTKRFFIPSLPSSLRSPPLPSKTSRPDLSRTFSTTSSSEDSSIASISQCETPTPISTSASSPSLTRSRSSEDSISTWNESLPPTTPYLVQMPLPADNDGYKRSVDGVGEYRGHHDHDCDLGKKFHYSDITITIKSASEDHETRPDQVLMTTELHSQPTSQQQQQQQQQQQPPAPQPTTINTPFQTPTFPKDIKKERSSLRKKLTMTTIRLTTPITRPATEVVGVKKIPVALPEVPVPLVLPSTLSVPMNNSLLLTSSISLPIPTSKKKKSSFKNLVKNFIAKW